ncbi:MAG: hypothetical protein KA343_11990 [Nitrosomonas sp.]|nr:hypothetical protein [Nitrosomonas sp.]
MVPHAFLLVLSFLYVASVNADNNCAKDFAGAYEVSFSGPVIANGILEVAEVQESNERASRARITLFGSPKNSSSESAETTLADQNSVSPSNTPENANEKGLVQINAVGVCNGSVLEYQLGAGSDLVSGYKILGGSLIAVMDSEVMPGPLGLWEVMLLETNTNQRQILRGQWSVRHSKNS